MLIIIFKIILCSSLLIGIYYLFLEREKMFRFNRFYLLFALVFSYAIPFVKINLPAVSQQKNQLVFEDIQMQQLIQNSSQVSQFDWLIIGLIIYALISIILIFKAFVSIFKIINLKGIDLVYQNQKIRLIENDLPPFSFWNKIYLSKTYFENGKIDNRIFLHEKTHLRQKHSLDLIFIEILKAISWFNPAIYFYKKAITSNHEFLADEEIINQQFSIKDYQKLILTEVLQVQNLSFINPFNFNNTKKRFIMMTTKKSKLENFKKLFVVSVIAGSGFFLVQKVYASEAKIEKQLNAPEISVNHSIEPDTIPQRIEGRNNVKLKNYKKVKTPPSPKELKENELPIPPPPPPARDFTNAEFPEGLNALRTNFSQNFDSSKFSKKDGLVKSKVYITIDENGNTKDVRAEGSNEAFNTEAVKTLKSVTEGKVWKPATEEGKPATTVFQLPITMKFE